MARLSDLIESFIKEILDESDGTAEIRRNELANYFNCVPSQINYVISTRFNNQQGYYVESKRGGGGNIVIKRVQFCGTKDYLMHALASLGDSISQRQAEVFINNLYDYNMITKREALIINAAVSDRSLSNIQQIDKDAARAAALRNILACIMV